MVPQCNEPAIKVVIVGFGQVERVVKGEVGAFGGGFLRSCESVGG